MLGGVDLTGQTMGREDRLVGVIRLAILLWLSVLSSIVQFAVSYYVLQRSDPGKTSAYLFLAPFFGVLTGWSVLGEPLHPSIIAGGLCIGSGIFLVNMDFKPRSATTKNSSSNA